MEDGFQHTLGALQIFSYALWSHQRTHFFFRTLSIDVPRNFLNHFVFVYLDDILIFSKNLQEHRVHVQAVLQQLLENRLYVKGEKCQFHSPSVTFLDYILAGGQVKTDPAKVRTILEWPTPTSRKHLQHFLGFANFYQRFIHNYSKVATPRSHPLRGRFFGLLRPKLPSRD